MTTIQPVRHLMLDLAGKVIRGEHFTDRENNMLAGFRQAFPDLTNPVHVRCTVSDHRIWGAVVFPGEVIEDGVVGNIAERNGEWICTLCGNGENVHEDVVRVF